MFNLNRVSQHYTISVKKSEMHFCCGTLNLKKTKDNLILTVGVGTVTIPKKMYGEEPFVVGILLVL